METQLNNEFSNSQPLPGFSIDGLKNEVDGMLNARVPSDSLQRVLETTARINRIKEEIIKYDEPMMLQGSNKIFFPNTINVIQGQAGVHKSRLAECICSAILKRPNCNLELLDFSRSIHASDYSVLYVDTERNQFTQFPRALQSIQMNAGYDIKEHPENLLYISIVEIHRKGRFQVLNEYLDSLNKNSDNPVFIVLDVSTDCIEDFNKTDRSMELIDLMNIAINQYNVIFLCLIHENPRTEKARGHFGTELMNKASTVMQVSFEKDAKQQDTNLVKVKYLKCRSTVRHEPFFVKYSDSTNGLVLASADDIRTVMNGKKQKADLNEMTEHLERILGNGQFVSRRELLDCLRDAMGASDKTIEDRLKEIKLNKMPIYNQNGIECFLDSERQSKTLNYCLSPRTEQSQSEDSN